MLQNVNSETQEEEIYENRINLLLKELFKPHNCLIYILTFLVSMVEIRNEALPFGLAIVGACLGSTIPIFMVYISSLLSVGIFYGGARVIYLFLYILNILCFSFCF